MIRALVYRKHSDHPSSLSRVKSLAVVLGFLCLLENDLCFASDSRRICTWTILGPFHQTNQPFLESELVPDLGETVAGFQWTYFDDRLYCRNQDDYNDLFTFYRIQRNLLPNLLEDCFAYVGTHIWSPVNQNIQLLFGVNDFGSVWLNGSLVLNLISPNQAQRDHHVVPIQLKSGWNRLVIKVVNHRRIWGFYCSIVDSQKKPVEGLEYSLNPSSPSVPLHIQTKGFPVAYWNQPYIELSVRNLGGDFESDNASASPYRMVAHGGNPPYRWLIEGLPTGLTSSESEGEILGKPQSVGNFPINVTVIDSSVPSRQESRQYNLVVKPRVTENWFETGNRIGGLRHNHPSAQLWGLDHPAEQVQLVSSLGYSWFAFTILSIYEVNSQRHAVLKQSPSTHQFVSAFRTAGLRFTAYVDMRDHRDLSVDDHEHLELKHEALEAMVLNYQPDFWWLDGGHNERYRTGEIRYLELDGIYSLLKAMNPDVLITMNADTRAREYEVGDLDVLEVHGSYCVPEAYWGYWPPDPPSGNNPKYQPIDTWKYQCPEHSSGGFFDWAEWCRVLVTLMAEPGNQYASRMMNLDWTPHPKVITLFNQMGEWINPRRESLFQVRPFSINEGNWGYDVINSKTGKVYLHLIANPRGKIGWQSGNLIISPVDFELSAVHLFPQNQPLEFHQNESVVTIQMASVIPDPVSTILELSPRIEKGSFWAIQ